MTTTVWLTIAGSAVVTAFIKGFGPVAVGGRDLPPRFAAVIALMAPALLSALVVTSTFAAGDQWRVGANTVGVAVAGVILVRRGPLVLAVAAAIATTALFRAIT